MSKNLEALKKKNREKRRQIASERAKVTYEKKKEISYLDIINQNRAKQTKQIVEKAQERVIENSKVFTQKTEIEALKKEKQDEKEREKAEKAVQPKRKGRPPKVWAKTKKNRYRIWKQEQERRWYQANREYKIKKVRERQELIRQEKLEFMEKYPERIQYMHEVNVQRMRDRWTKKRNENNPEKSYMDTYWKIVLSSNATHPLIDDDKEKWVPDFDEILEQLKQIRLAKTHFTKERNHFIRRSWEMDIPLKDYIDKVEELNAERDREIQMEESLRSFLVENMSDEDLKEHIEIQQRLAELNKITPFYNPDEEDKDQHEYIIKEIKKDMAKISFDKGKTYLDILDDRDHNIILSKISKMKVWQNVVENFEGEAMMRALDKMSANERKLCTQGNKAENRMLYLGKYLAEAEMNLIV